MKFNAKKDYYAVLRVSHRASGDEIHQAYKSLVSKYHPDKHQGNDLEELAREKLTEINEAYAVLSKPDNRRLYDAARQTATVPPSTASGGNYAAPNAPRQGGADTIRKFVFLLIFLGALPFILRFVRSPRAAAVIAIAILIAWFGPRIIKKMKR